MSYITVSGQTNGIYDIRYNNDMISTCYKKNDLNTLCVLGGCKVIFNFSSSTERDDFYNSVGDTTITSVLLTGYILNTGGKSILTRGFKYGTSVGTLDTTVMSIDTSIEFYATISVKGGTYYYQAFATNSIGESVAEIKTFTI